jgi:2-polyprenyl-3-methyl-5-hydroxy-6-metoxy-1,4-benzoquinol methylase
MADRKEAERAYPELIEESGRDWLRSKPFGNSPRETARLLIDFGYIVQLLDLQPGMSICELGCGPGWMTRMAARHGLEAVGFDISPGMIEIAREQAQAEGVEASFEVADMEELDAGGRFDTCIVYDALHHSPRADLVIASARRALRPGGRFLLAEPNWKHRFQGRNAADAFGVTELGYTPRRFKRMLRDAGFVRIERFHNNRKRLFSNRPREVAAHLAEPFVFRALGIFWTQIWLRATAP